MNIAFTENLQRLIRQRVEQGQFPNEEAVVEEALKQFLVEEPFQGSPPAISAIDLREKRLPGPFIEDEICVAPVDLTRPGKEIGCSYLHGSTRQPTLFPGE